MSNIDFEDRTDETQDQVDQRHALGAGLMVAQVAYQIANGNPRLALYALSAATAYGIARSDSAVEEIIGLIRSYAALARQQIDAAPGAARNPGN